MAVITTAIICGALATAVASNQLNDVINEKPASEEKSDEESEDK